MYEKYPYHTLQNVQICDLTVNSGRFASFEWGIFRIFAAESYEY